MAAPFFLFFMSILAKAVKKCNPGAQNVAASTDFDRTRAARRLETTGLDRGNRAGRAAVQGRLFHHSGRTHRRPGPPRPGMMRIDVKKDRFRPQKRTHFGKGPKASEIPGTFGAFDKFFLWARVLPLLKNTCFLASFRFFGIMTENDGQKAQYMGAFPLQTTIFSENRGRCCCSFIDKWPAA